MTDIRKMPVRREAIKMDGEYDGWEFDARTNVKVRTFQKLQSGVLDEIVQGLKEIVLSWNFVDEEGNALGSPNENMEELPLDMLNAMISAYVKGVAELSPKS